MASAKQIAANRRNAQKSTGPRTPQGKLKSRCNALRHGLTAETVIDVFENVEDYQTFEQALLAHYAPASIVARELTLRLASLLWRLRRATAIETGLLKIQAQAVRDRKQQRQRDDQYRKASRPDLYHLLGVVYGRATVPAVVEGGGSDLISASPSAQPQKALTLTYLRAAHRYNVVLDRLTRYEVSLWRQVAQTLLLLQSPNVGSPVRERAKHITSDRCIRLRADGHPLPHE
jgi:hypothetical protein